ncbi:MAG: hypothetical protein HWN68_19575 [Desulfobacterales bacterium]|nr:hypothetical protein [Desulfobacterales bacterium]
MSGPESNIIIRLNTFQSGILMAVIMESEHKDGPLKNVYEQLIEIKKQLEKEAGVEKELLPNGLLKLTDKDGNTIVRPPMDWEGFPFRGEK